MTDSSQHFGLIGGDFVLRPAWIFDAQGTDPKRPGPKGNYSPYAAIRRHPQASARAQSLNPVGHFVPQDLPLLRVAARIMHGGDRGRLLRHVHRRRSWLSEMPGRRGQLLRRQVQLLQVDVIFLRPQPLPFADLQKSSTEAATSL